MSETVTGRNTTRKVYKVIEERNPKKATDGLRASLAIYFGTIFVLAAIFGMNIYLEEQKNFQMVSRLATTEELAKIKSEYNMIGTTAVINIPQYEDVAASVIEKADGKYEIIMAKYGNRNLIPGIEYRLILQTTDGSIIQMDRSFQRSTKMFLKNEKDILSLNKKVERWNIEV